MSSREVQGVCRKNYSWQLKSSLSMMALVYNFLIVFFLLLKIMLVGKVILDIPK